MAAEVPKERPNDGRIEDTVPLEKIYELIERALTKGRSKEARAKDRVQDLVLYLSLAAGLNYSLSSIATPDLYKSGVLGTFIFAELLCTFAIVFIYKIGKNYVRRSK